MAIYVNVGGINKEMAQLHGIVGGVNKQFTEAYTVVGGVNKQIFTSKIEKAVKFTNGVDTTETDWYVLSDILQIGICGTASNAPSAYTWSSWGATVNTVAGKYIAVRFVTMLSKPMGSDYTFTIYLGESPVSIILSADSGPSTKSLVLPQLITEVANQTYYCTEVSITNAGSM